VQKIFNNYVGCQRWIIFTDYTMNNKPWILSYLCFICVSGRSIVKLTTFSVLESLYYGNSALLNHTGKKANFVLLKENFLEWWIIWEDSWMLYCHSASLFAIYEMKLLQSSLSLDDFCYYGNIYSRMKKSACDCRMHYFLLSWWLKNCKKILYVSDEMFQCY
jgi:hypothetical protein